jgi:hypothetical protein
VDLSENRSPGYLGLGVTELTSERGNGLTKCRPLGWSARLLSAQRPARLQQCLGDSGARGSRRYVRLELRDECGDLRLDLSFGGTRGCRRSRGTSDGHCGANRKRRCAGAELVTET